MESIHASDRLISSEQDSSWVSFDTTDFSPLLPSSDMEGLLESPSFHTDITRQTSLVHESPTRGACPFLSSYTPSSRPPRLPYHSIYSPQMIQSKGDESPPVRITDPPRIILATKLPLRPKPDYINSIISKLIQSELI